MVETKLFSPELHKCYLLYNHKQIHSKVPTLYYFVEPKEPLGNCYVSCLGRKMFEMLTKNNVFFTAGSWEEDIIFDGHLTQILVLLILAELYYIFKITLITKNLKFCEILINSLQKGRRMRNSTPFSGCSSHRDQSSQSVLRGNLAHTQRSIFFVLSFLLLYVTLDGEPLCNIYTMR